ncbi:MAG: DNA-binding domain-containing protein [Pseudomonadota bacterium]
MSSGDEASGDPAGAGRAAFARALLDPSAPTPADLATLGGRPAAKRFAVYRNNVTLSLIDAVRAAFPSVRALAGAEAFDAAAARFVRESPPTSPVMIAYGAAFPDWLRAYPPAAARPDLADLAALDWALREAYHAADAPALSQTAFARLAAGLDDAGAGALAFDVHPAVRVVASEHALFGLWRRARGLEAEPEAGEGEPPDAGRTVLVTRPELEVSVYAAPAGSDAVVAALARGADLAEASAAGQARLDERATESDAEGRVFDLEATLRLFLHAGALLG